MEKTDKDTDFDRWLKAQSEEKKFWLKSKHAGDRDREFWAKNLKKGFGLNFDFFKNKDILEIGSGPSGIIYRITEAKSRIGIEPMDMSDIIEDWKKPFAQRGTGENLPFNDNEFDVVICFNVLDHTTVPGTVLTESSRVLRKNGEFLLGMHVLRNQYKIFRKILNKIDSPHPHHLTASEVKELTAKHFRIEKERAVKGLGLDGHAKTYGNFKTFVGNYVMENIWMILKKSA